LLLRPEQLGRRRRALEGGGLKLLLLQLLSGAGCWGGLWALLLQAVQGRWDARELLQLRAQDICAPSAAQVLATGSLKILTAALPLTPRATW
jgi:hypothetical protein